jgi:hypothetical protein
MLEEQFREKSQTLKKSNKNQYSVKKMGVLIIFRL